MFDVVAMGEILIDFTPAGTGPMGHPCFEMNPGGAPANCLAAVSAFGGSAAFIGKIGRDNFGEFLYGKLEAAGIDASGVVFTEKVHTTLTFVHLDGNGERSFSFLRNPGADIMMQKEEIRRELIDAAGILHFGSLAFTDEPLREAMLNALQYAKKQGKTISYDPNYRKMLWESEEEARYWMKKGLDYADIVKMSEEEMSILTGYPEDEIEKGAEAVYKTGKEAVFVTMGKNGAYYLTGNGKGFVRAYPLPVADTTGCGDAFMGAMLYLYRHHPEMPIKEKAGIACAAGSLCATKKGGFSSMPDYKTARFLANDGKD
jgi:fructokinase